MQELPLSREAAFSCDDPSFPSKGVILFLAPVFWHVCWASSLCAPSAKFAAAAFCVAFHPRDYWNTLVASLSDSSILSAFFTHCQIAQAIANWLRGRLPGSFQYLCMRRSFRLPNKKFSIDIKVICCKLDIQPMGSAPSLFDLYSLVKGSSSSSSVAWASRL